MQSKFCSSKNGITRHYCISLDKEIIILEYLQIFVRKTTLESCRCCNVNARSENRVTTSEIQRCDNVVTTFSDVTTKIQPKLNVVTTSCASWVGTKSRVGRAIRENKKFITQFCVRSVIYEKYIPTGCLLTLHSICRKIKEI